MRCRQTGEDNEGISFGDARRRRRDIRRLRCTLSANFLKE
jgi:hypothetical protein